MIVVIIRLPLRSLPSGFRDRPHFITNFSLCRCQAFISEFLLVGFTQKIFQPFFVHLIQYMRWTAAVCPALNQSHVLQASSPESSDLTALNSPGEALSLPQALSLLLPYCQRQSGQMRIPAPHMNFGAALFIPQPATVSFDRYISIAWAAYFILPFMHHLLSTKFQRL